MDSLGEEEDDSGPVSEGENGSWRHSSVAMASPVVLSFGGDEQSRPGRPNQVARGSRAAADRQTPMAATAENYLWHGSVAVGSFALHGSIIRVTSDAPGRISALYSAYCYRAMETGRTEACRRDYSS